MNQSRDPGFKPWALVRSPFRAWGCPRAEGTIGPKAGVSTPVDRDKKYLRPEGTPDGAVPDGAILRPSDNLHAIVRKICGCPLIPLILDSEVREQRSEARSWLTST